MSTEDFIKGGRVILTLEGEWDWHDLPPKVKEEATKRIEQALNDHLRRHSDAITREISKRLADLGSY